MEWVSHISIAIWAKNRARFLKIILVGVAGEANREERKEHKEE
jgi:hypothetical protein